MLFGTPGRTKPAEPTLEPAEALAPRRGVSEQISVGEHRVEGSRRVAADAKTGLLAIRGLAVTAGGADIVRDIDLDVPAGSFFTILGPSGAGKTTVLRAVAGLVRVASGSIQLDNQELTKVPVQQRGIGAIFQRYALFPHLNVQENVAFGLRARHVGRGERVGRVRELLELVGLETHARKYPGQLSGGEQQRVAIARALAVRPRLLLMDEPVSALDRNLRLSVLREIDDLHRRLGITIISITHDPADALSTSDSIGIMRAGHLEAVGAPERLYESPPTAFVAHFLGECNALPVRITERTSEYVVARVRDSAVSFPVAVERCSAQENDAVFLLRPGQAECVPAGETGTLSGQVVERRYEGERIVLTVQTGVYRVSVVDNARTAQVGDLVGVRWRHEHGQLVAKAD